MMALLSFQHNDLKKIQPICCCDLSKLPSLNFQAAFLLSTYLPSFTCFVLSTPVFIFSLSDPIPFALEKNPVGKVSEHRGRAFLRSVLTYLSVHSLLSQKHMEVWRICHKRCRGGIFAQHVFSKGTLRLTKQERVCQTLVVSEKYLREAAIQGCTLGQGKTFFGLVLWKLSSTSVRTWLL